MGSKFLNNLGHRDFCELRVRSENLKSKVSSKCLLQINTYFMANFKRMAQKVINCRSLSQSSSHHQVNADSS